MECERCDLYAGVDEEKAIKKAAKEAEREWKRRYLASESVDGKVKKVTLEALKVIKTDWSWRWDEIMDWLVGVMVA